MSARVIVDGDAEYTITRDAGLVIGRTKEGTQCHVGLDETDVGISRLTVEFRATDDGVVVTNISTKKPVYIDREGTGRLYTLRPGDRYLASSAVGIEVRGLIRVHRLEVVPDVEGHGGRTQPAFDGRATLVDEFEYSEGELDALTAMFQGYLAAFPRRDCRPNSYDEAGRLLDVPASTVRRRIERLRERLHEIDVYIEGPEARHELANYVLDNGAITPNDLSRLTSQAPDER